MRIWKRLLGTALCLCAAVCVMSVSASAEGEHTGHPICGVSHENIGDHTDECESVPWTAWDGMGKITYTGNTAYVYLSGSATPSSTLTVTDGKTLNLCLNGKTLSRSSTVIEVKGNATLNICDCQGNGKITSSSTSNCVVSVKTVNKSNVDTTLNLYCGTISGSVNDGLYDKGIIKLSNNDINNSETVAVFNMYGGGVNNTGSGDAVDVSYANVGTGYYNINMYGGSVTCPKGDGFGNSFNGSKNITMQITGGTITSGKYGVNLCSSNTLTLAGVPQFIDGKYGNSYARIYIPDNVTLTVKDDFAPAGRTKVSVEKSVGSSGSVVFAAPTESNKSLSSKAQHFVSAKEGYFVESNDDGELQLTACAITGQPTAGNSYTVTANGSDDKVKYQWCNAKSGEVPVTKNSVKGTGNLSYWNEEWSCSPGEVTGFTLTMKKGDVLTLDCSGNYGVHIGSVALSDGENTVGGIEGEDQTYTLTAPADGDYTLKISYVGDERPYLQFTAKVTADVPDMTNPLSGQTAAKLNTTDLPSGSYICQVTWENKTTRNSHAVRYAAASSHVHSWLTEWKSDDTHHWHECKNENCPVTENSAKDGYGPHSGGTATCQAKAVCVTCGTAYGDLDPNGHDWGAWAVTTPATTSAAGVETRVCQRNASHTETRAIPKLTPAPSGGGSSSTPAVTVPVSGSGDTVHVSASVSGSTAEVKEIKSAELDKIGTDSAVVIDLSGLNKGVTGVTLSTDTIDSICKTEADGVTIKLPNAELRVDRQTLAAVTEQAAGSKIRLVVEPDGTARSTMTAAQKSTLDGMRNAAVLEAYFVSDGTRIRDFKGGSVELSIPYRAEGAIRAWFLKEDGTREPVSARYDKENAQLILHHFSHYVIEELDSSAAYTVCAKDDSCPLGAFGDLTATAWYHDGVHYCIENGLMRGVSGGKFLPDGSTTRAQLVTILWRLEGSPETTGAVRFGDTAGGAWYTEAVRWTAGCGVVKGYDNGCFGPNDAVTREQMAAILYRYAQHKGYDVSAGNDTNILSFDDAFAVSEYAIPAMQWACGSGLMTGTRRDGGMALAPRDTTTRAQTATLLMRFQSAFAKEP